MDKLIKSAFYIVTCCGAGYGLLMICTLNPPEINKLRDTYPGAEKSPAELSKKQGQFAQVIQSASNSSLPLYRLTKEEIDKEIRKNK